MAQQQQQQAQQQADPTLEECKQCCQDPDCCEFIKQNCPQVAQKAHAASQQGVGGFDWIALLSELPAIFDVIKRWWNSPQGVAKRGAMSGAGAGGQGQPPKAQQPKP